MNTKFLRVNDLIISVSPNHYESDSVFHLFLEQNGLEVIIEASDTFNGFVSPDIYFAEFKQKGMYIRDETRICGLKNGFKINYQYHLFVDITDRPFVNKEDYNGDRILGEGKSPIEAFNNLVQRASGLYVILKSLDGLSYNCIQIPNVQQGLK